MFLVDRVYVAKDTAPYSLRLEECGSGVSPASLGVGHLGELL